MRRLLATIAISSCLLAGLPIITSAQGLPGLTLFGGIKRENQLPFRLDFGGQVNTWDRYRLRIPAKKLNLAVSQFAISYPDYYKGKFDTDNIEIRLKGKKVPLQEVVWDKENHKVEIFPQEPIPAGSRLELVFSNVKNPNSGGTFYFNCQVLSPGDTPLLRYLGTWIVNIT
jgi:hypothetical protein